MQGTNPNQVPGSNNYPNNGPPSGPPLGLPPGGSTSYGNSFRRLPTPGQTNTGQTGQTTGGMN